MDSDDYVDGDFVSLMMEAIEKYDVPMAQISRDEINEDGTKRDDICTPPKEDYMILMGHHIHSVKMVAIQ